MRIFLAGATGIIGTRLIPLLKASNHEVVGMTRTPEKCAMLQAMGAESVVVDAFNKEALIAAVIQAKPEIVIHQLTALSSLGKQRSFDRQFELTNRLRTETTAYLLTAARAAGAQKFIAQSYAGWPFAREGGPVKTEDDPLDSKPVAGMSQTLHAIRELESMVSAARELEGIVLRYGGLYGRGTSLGTGGRHVDLIRNRRFPIVGSGAGIWSFIHVHDAAVATLQAIDHGIPGIYNIVDDEPAPVSVWLPVLASAIGAKPPMHVPTWMGRILAGEYLVAMMTQIRGASNAKAKSTLHWQLRYPSWRKGFAQGLGE